eukprot:3221892-Karenia_brevis.AAC.1
MAPKIFKRPSAVMKRKPACLDLETQTPSKRRCFADQASTDNFAIDSAHGASSACVMTIGSEKKIQKKVWLCKSGCTKKDGKRKQAQSGCKGYCSACFNKKYPRLARDKAKTRQTLCFACGASTGQTAQGVAIQGDRYCRRCTSDLFPEHVPCRAGEKRGRGTKRKASVFSKQAGHKVRAQVKQYKCFYCFSVEEGVGPQRCEYKVHQRPRTVVVCNSCRSQDGKVVCGVCWYQHWEGKCFMCQKLEARRALPWGRFCKRCHNVFSNKDGPCYFCGGVSADVQLRSCEHSPEPRHLRFLLQTELGYAMFSLQTEKGPG